MIYFAQVGSDGPIKIGRTSGAPHRRIANLQTGCPLPIRLIGSINGDDARERLLHDHFVHERLEGEWFTPSERLLAVIDEVLAGTFDWCAITPSASAPTQPTRKYAGYLLTVVREYCVARGLSKSRVSTIFFNDGKKIGQIEAGGGLTTDKFEEVMAKFSAQWPENTLWPIGVPRPAPLEAERAS